MFGASCHAGVSRQHNRPTGSPTFPFIFIILELETRLLLFGSMVNLVRLSLVFAVIAAAQGATMEYLSTDEMIDQATAIVRARVVESGARQHGALVYTHFTVRVLERLKGNGPERLDVAIPGGNAGGIRQTFAGAPVLTKDNEYLLFLWTGTSGMTQVLGFSQGVFRVSVDRAGERSAARVATGEVMLEAKTGRRIADQPVQMRLRELRSRIASRTTRGGEIQ